MIDVLVYGGTIIAFNQFVIDSGTLLQERFLVEEKIGVGGMGAVYRAVDQKFGTQVAIKETFYGNTDLAEAFEREARLLNGLHHPILPHVSDYFTENGEHFLVMEYIDGDDMSELLKRGKVFSVDTVVGWTRDLLDGLDYLHSQDPPIIHRDIKPNNLKLTSRGKIVLLDFGMAKETSGNTLGAKSVFGYSRRYSPLEQIEGSGTDARSDIFSLGATVYHLLTGKPPTDVLARASAIVAGRPDPLLPVKTINVEVPEAISDVLSTALALNPENRFQSSQKMSEAFETAMTTGEPIAYAEEAWQDTMPVPVPVNEAAPDATIDLPQQISSAAGPIVLTEEDLDPMAAVIKTAPAFSARGEFRRRMGKALPGRFASVQFRRPSRPNYVVLVPLLLFALALGLYATYRGLRPDRDESVTYQPTEVPQVETNSSSEASGTEVAAPASPEITQPDDSVAAVADDEEPSSKGGEIVNPLDLRKGPIVTSSDRTGPSPKKDDRVTKEPAKTSSRSGPDKPQTKRASSQRPRRVAEPVFEQPRVSSIEAIMTGVPSDRRRRWIDQQIQMDEEFRRRQLRRMRRDAQRRPFPY